MTGTAAPLRPSYIIDEDTLAPGADKKAVAAKQ
jgi:hypothetical protein